MNEAVSQERRFPKRRRKLDTEVDFDAFARVGKQLQEDVVDLKERNQALNLANEQLRNENKWQKTSLLVQETMAKAKSDTIELLQETVDTVTTEKQVLIADLNSVESECEDLCEEKDDLKKQIELYQGQIFAYQDQMVETDAELARYRQDATKLADLTEDNERTKVLLKRTQGMHSEALGELCQARESISILKNLLESEPECVFCLHSDSNGEYVDSKCNRCSVFYHKTCCRSSILKCPQCQLEWS